VGTNWRDLTIFIGFVEIVGICEMFEEVLKNLLEVV
jgi:hypothetical protein